MHLAVALSATSRAALARLDRIDRRLREMLIEEAESSCNTRSGVRRITLPPTSKTTSDSIR